MLILKYFPSNILKYFHPNILKYFHSTILKYFPLNILKYFQPLPEVPPPEAEPPYPGHHTGGRPLPLSRPAAAHRHPPGHSGLLQVPVGQFPAGESLLAAPQLRQEKSPPALGPAQRRPQPRRGGGEAAGGDPEAAGSLLPEAGQLAGEPAGPAGGQVGNISKYFPAK